MKTLISILSLILFGYSVYSQMYETRTTIDTVLVTQHYKVLHSDSKSVTAKVRNKVNVTYFFKDSVCTSFNVTSKKSKSYKDIVDVLVVSGYMTNAQKANQYICFEPDSSGIITRATINKRADGSLYVNFETLRFTTNKDDISAFNL